MNPLLGRLQPYPFERLRKLLADNKPPAHLPHINLGIGEPRHATPTFIQQAMVQAITSQPSGLASYPATLGEPALREAIANWVQRRYRVSLNPSNQILPVNGSREALFALTQAVVDPTASACGVAPLVVCPNPFYQIYEGAALLAGAQPHYLDCRAEHGFLPRWDQVPDAVWARTQLLIVCSPGNPTGAVLTQDDWHTLFELSDRYGFVVASDECYSEIYNHEPPLGALQAAAALGRTDYTRLVVLTSLSKRSSVPGLRSGFVAGDANLLAGFLLYRTYHGCAMSAVVQAASRAAWEDEAHVEENRTLYRRKFAEVTPLLSPHVDVQAPPAGFYLWANVGGDDTTFARALHALYNVTVLPGSYLSRDGAHGNPGAGYVRMALVAAPEECLEATRRIVEFVRQYKTGSI